MLAMEDKINKFAESTSFNLASLGVSLGADKKPLDRPSTPSSVELRQNTRNSSRTNNNDKPRTLM
jgi:hypothetical protein